MKEWNTQLYLSWLLGSGAGTSRSNPKNTCDRFASAFRFVLHEQILAVSCLSTSLHSLVCRSTKPWKHYATLVLQETLSCQFAHSKRVSLSHRGWFGEWNQHQWGAVHSKDHAGILLHNHLAHWGTLGMMHVQSGLPPQPTASIGWRALGAYSDFGRCSFAPAPQIVLAVLLVHVLVALSIFLVRSALKAPTILVSYDVKMDCKVRVDVQIQALYHHHLTWVFCWDSGSDSSESYVPVEQRALRSLHLDSIRMVTQYLL